MALMKGRNTLLSVLNTQVVLDCYGYRLCVRVNAQRDKRRKDNYRRKKWHWGIEIYNSLRKGREIRFIPCCAIRICRENTSESRSKIPVKFLNVMWEKDGEYQLDRSAVRN
jgi:hypothetical protein